MTARQARALADAINQRWVRFDPGGSCEFGAQEVIYAVADVLAEDATFDRTDFLHRCFSSEEPQGRSPRVAVEPYRPPRYRGEPPEMDASEGMGYWPGEDESPGQARALREWNR